METRGDKQKTRQPEDLQNMLPGLKPLHPAIVGVNRKSHVLIGGIEEITIDTYAAPLILPPREEGSPLNPFREHVKGATMFDALGQLFVGSRRQFHGDHRMAYKLRKSSEKFRMVLKPDEPATVIVSYGEPRTLHGNTIYRVSGEIVNSKNQAVMKSHFLMTSNPLPREPKPKV